MSCALLLGLIWGLFHESSAQYCVDQPDIEESFLGDSITIPCKFSYPNTISPLSVTLIVKAAQEYFCGVEDDEIYSSFKNYTSDKYTERLSAQVDLKTGTSSVTIKDLRREDHKMYCCRYILNISEGYYERWQSPYGTSVVVKGEKEMILEQEPFILALPGDVVTIITQFTLKNQTTTSNVTECGMSWSREDRHCGSTLPPVTCTQRSNENIVIVKVNDTNSTNSGFYCFSISVSGGGSNYTGRTNIGSNLLVLEPSDMSKVKVNQSAEVEIRGPVRINCSFSVGNRSVLWTQVYWMAGEPREDFVYHPNVDFIHPQYKGKTTLIGQSDLLLQDFPGPDNTTLYCRVAIRFCTATPSNQNSITTILEEGPGTVIRVYDNSDSESRASNPELTTIIIMASGVGGAVILFLVLLIIGLKTRRGEKNNSRETIVETTDISVYRNSAYENMEVFTQHTTGTDEKMVYATVNHSTAPKRSQAPKEPKDEKMVYAMVNHSTTPKRSQAPMEPEVVYADVKKQ